MVLPHLVFKEWMLETALLLKPKIFEKLLMVIGSLWKNRNTMLWEDKSQSALLCSSFTWLEEFKKARIASAAQKQVVKHRWQPTNGNRIKMNVNGAFLSSLMHGGAGGVARNASGQFMAAFANHLPHVNSAKQAELLAIQTGLEMTVGLQLPFVTIETDCLTAVQAIMHPQYEFSEYAGIIADIHDLQMKFQETKIHFAPRECNRVAHRLANIGFESGQNESWFQQAPICITDVLHYDCNHLS
ncbi:uncharacterized protein LOC112203805 [Rosa chinensis]|uniref:uncharacterized protein LOC112203805 n=1 Tax=Rosa chinensis TaxID=74649 RepID=UPI000D08C1EF|nr:uncharacterized protein LOC112203805 [Rosa chinensis]